jgi:hypothetical protein
MKRALYSTFFLITSIVFAQGKNTLSDEKYLQLQTKTKTLVNSDIDSAFIYVNEIQKSNNYIHKVFALGTKSYLYQLKGDPFKSKQAYRSAFQYLNKITDSKSKINLNAYLLNCGGLAEWNRGNLSNALNLYNQGKKLSE